jgi:two-component system, chemotaxis family, chemotaxis protein CheY
VRALIVDDSKAMRMILRRALSACGYDDFVEAGNGREALRALVNEAMPDTAFVDWNMPEMNGIEFVRAVRKNAAFASMPIVMVTSETSFETIQEAMEAGADEYVMKPFTPEILGEKLALVRASRG